MTAAERLKLRRAVAGLRALVEQNAILRLIDGVDLNSDPEVIRAAVRGALKADAIIQ